MHKHSLLALGLVFSLALAAHGDLIYLKNGNTIEAYDIVEKGDFYYFSVASGRGRMGLEKALIERIVKTGTRPTITYSPANTSATSATDNPAVVTAGVETGGGTWEDMERERAEETNRLITEKVQTQFRIYNLEQEIVGLDGIIQAKSVGFYDSTTEFQQREEKLREIDRLREDLQRLDSEALRSGILPAQRRLFESVNFDPADPDGWREKLINIESSAPPDRT